MVLWLGSTDADRIVQMFRLTIRATDEAVPSVLLKYMVEQLSQGIQDEDGPFEND